MARLRPLYLLAVAASSGFVALTSGCEDDPSGPGGDIGLDGGPVVFDASYDAPSIDTGTDAADGGAHDAAVDGDACTPGPLVVMDGGGIAPVPYLQASDSPFACRPFTYYYIEDFEDGGVHAPGLVALSGALTSAHFDPNAVDSVDGDNGVLSDGGPDACAAGCESWIAGESGISFSFDEAVLGDLPTHAGVVWTDGQHDISVTFEAYGADGGLLTRYVTGGIGDESQHSTAGEDRFFGAVNPAGIQRIKIFESDGGLEVDHVQYAR